MTPSFDPGRIVVAGLVNALLLMPAFALGGWLARRCPPRGAADPAWARLVPWVAVVAWALPLAGMLSAGWTLARPLQPNGGAFERRLAKGGFVLAVLATAWFGSAVLGAGRCR